MSPEAGAGRWWEQPMFNWRGKKPERTRGAKSPPPKRSPSPQRSTPWWTEKRTSRCSGSPLIRNGSHNHRDPPAKGAARGP